MGFLTNINNTNKTGAVPTPFDLKCAKYLSTTLAKNRRRHPTYNLIKWSNEFRLLRNYFSEEEIKTTLIWYAKNLKGKYTPDARSAATFRKKFIRIQTAMQRARTGPVPPGVSAQSISAAARAIYDDLGLYWPEGTDITDNDVLRLIDVCYSRYAAWYIALVAAANENPKRADIKAVRNQRLFQALLCELALPCPYTEQWILGIHRFVWSRKQWQGDLQRLAWHPGHPLFTAMGQRFCLDYCCDAKRWDEVVLAARGQCCQSTGPKHEQIERR